MKVLVCPSCRSVVICPSHLVGTVTLCPNCQRELAVPAEAASGVEELERVKKHIEDTPGNRPVDETQTDAGEGRDTDNGD